MLCLHLIHLDVCVMDGCNCCVFLHCSDRYPGQIFHKSLFFFMFQSSCCPSLFCLFLFILSSPKLLTRLSSFILFVSFLTASLFHQMSEIKNELDTLPMRAMLAAAFITYLSAASEDRRKNCLETWMAQSGLQSKYTI